MLLLRNWHGEVGRVSQTIFTVQRMTLVRWLLTLGTAQAANNAGHVLEARRRAEAQVDAAARRLAEHVAAAAAA